MYFLNELNPIQKAAAEQTEGPVMIIAGAGSGKTRVLTYRIAHIIEKGIDPFNILALTFTNKAAREMKDRIAKLVGNENAKSLWMGTFHSVFAKLLRIESEKIGYPHNFTIYDTDDSKSVIKDILKQFNLDDKTYKPSLVLNRISEAKNKLISAQQYLNNPIIQQEDYSSRKPLIGKIFEAYQKRNFKNGAMDFDDLLYQTNILLRDFPEVLYKYQNKFRYILVDEYQDTNFSQYVIIKQLAARFQNICVVGDDAQSIYAFRGANIQNILNFEKDYPDLKTFKLEQNYRSTKNIVEAANHIISNNKEQLKKQVFTLNEEGEKLKVFSAASDSEEGKKIANSIFETKANKQAINSNFAVLYRTNSQSRSFEEAFRRLNIPYRIYGGVSFYQRKEIKDAIAYFRLTINSADDESLKRIINYPARGIGQTTIDKIMLAAAEHEISMWEVINNLKLFNLGINSGISTKINDFTVQIKNFQLALLTKDAYELANFILVNTGIVKELYIDKTPEGVSRYENLQELLNGIKDFVEQERTPQEDEINQIIKEALYTTSNEENNKGIKTLDEFMQEITLLTNVDNEKDDEKNADKVSLMTIHASKGLEFPYVYVVGLEENLFPSQLSINSREDLEEERRLFYVAVTRAEKKCTLSYAKMRYRFGNVTFCEPSRFIEEINEEFLDFEGDPEKDLNTFGNNVFDKFRGDYNDLQFDNFKGGQSFKNFTNNNHSNINFKPTEKKLVKLTKQIINTPSKPVDLNFNKSIILNQTLLHDKFGKGTVVALEGNWPDTKATIQFDKGEVKTLLLRFARFEKAE
ncbi:MAG: UvrD-helicase domain-containing protein [Bacteroidetes bacterium]|nr:UvrD-helicase domain-containing protein [Bacteroidota bacterium]